MKLKYNDNVHGYWLDGKRCRGISTIAKIPDDTFTLDNWRKRMVLVGAVVEPSLITAAAEVLGDDKALNELAESALDYAGAFDAARKGTGTHSLTEAHDLGEEVDDKHTAAQWTALLDHAGLEIDPDYIERCVVYPDQHVAGRFDRFARRRADSRLVPVDLKTGGSSLRYPHSVATQLALYANAPLIAADLDEGGVTEQLTSTADLDLDRDVGYMIYMPEDGEGAVYAVNLKRAWKVAEGVIFPTLKWRATKVEDIIKKV